MGRRNSKKKKTEILKYDCSCISEKRMVEIQAEAYYRALKKIEQDELEIKEPETDKEKPTKNNLGHDILFLLNVIFLPWRISKKFKLKDNVYDNLLVLSVSGILQIIGTIVWLLGLVMVFDEISGISKKEPFSISTLIIIISVGIMVIIIGSIAILSGREFSKETDSNKIYAYSANIIALLSCVVSIIAILKM